MKAPDLVRISARVEQTLEHAAQWLAQRDDAQRIESGARRLALTLGRTLALALLARHAQWSLQHECDERPLAAARRFASSAFDLLHDMNAEDARRLASDEK